MVLSVLVIGLLGVLDTMTGYELSFSLFYVGPIAMTTWRSGRAAGLGTSVLSAVAWLLADIDSGHVYSPAGIYFWNSLIRLGFFVLTTLLPAALGEALTRACELARIDYVTGAVNARWFSEIAATELSRARRNGHPLSIAYVDVDDFRAVNDRLGPTTGDRVLRTIAQRMRSQLRSTDVVARLGGDEFAVLLPETGEAAALSVVCKLREGLQEDLRTNRWTFTVSIGVLSCLNAPSTVDELMGLADRLMYTAKSAGKGSVCNEVYPSPMYDIP